MSDDVERVFSGCRRTISWERARLGLDKVEAVECLGSWFPLNAEDEVGGLGNRRGSFRGEFVRSPGSDTRGIGNCFKTSHHYRWQRRKQWDIVQILQTALLKKYDDEDHEFRMKPLMRFRGRGSLIPCLAHVINLVCKEVLSSLKAGSVTIPQANLAYMTTPSSDLAIIYLPVRQAKDIYSWIFDSSASQHFANDVLDLLAGSK